MRKTPAAAHDTRAVVDEAGTRAFGFALGRALRRGDIVGLVGDLGAGKTALTRAVARGAGIPAATVVNSPTFTILNVYRGTRRDLLHLDLYRLAAAEELDGLGLPDLLAMGHPLIVEWFDRFPDAFPGDRLVITIEIRVDTHRKFRLAAGGDASVALLERFRRVLIRRASSA